MKHELRALTLHRPWPYPIAIGVKKVENRTWEAPIAMGKWIAIHAGKAWDAIGAQVIFSRLWPDRLRYDREVGQKPIIDSFPIEATVSSSIIALVRYAGTFRPDTGRFVGDDRNQIPAHVEDWWAREQYGWYFDAVWKLPHQVDATGAQGLWTVGPTALDAIREQAKGVHVTDVDIRHWSALLTQLGIEHVVRNLAQEAGR